LDAPIARTPVNFGPKSCFLVSYSPSPTCRPNLKLLASTVAEINSGSQIFTCSPSADPINFGPESCFGKLLPYPSCVKKFSTICIYDDGNSVFRAKKLLFVMQNLGIWGLMGIGGQNMSSKVPYLESPTLICRFTMQLLWGYDDD